jgi:prolipoprotein diacylglyceryltransferase
MKLKMAKNSLFAVLLRSPLWYSLLIVVGFAIAAMSAWRRWSLPNPKKVSDALARGGQLSWAP